MQSGNNRTFSQNRNGDIRFAPIKEYNPYIEATPLHVIYKTYFRIHSWYTYNSNNELRHQVSQLIVNYFSTAVCRNV